MFDPALFDAFNWINQLPFPKLKRGCWAVLNVNEVLFPIILVAFHCHDVGVFKLVSLTAIKNDATGTAALTEDTSNKILIALIPHDNFGIIHIYTPTNTYPVPKLDQFPYPRVTFGVSFDVVITTKPTGYVNAFIDSFTSIT